jgi:hypothetical protein
MQTEEGKREKRDKEAYTDIILVARAVARGKK